MARQNSGDRKFNGIIRSFVASGTPVRGRWRYTAVIVPRLWFMKQTTDCRIFQAMTVIDILNARCGEISQTVNVMASGPMTREYITQYNETDFEFIQRLMEQEGYWWYFVHVDGDYVLTVCNKNQSFPASPKPSMYVVHEGGGENTLTDWRKVRSTMSRTSCTTRPTPSTTTAKPPSPTATRS